MSQSSPGQREGPSPQSVDPTATGTWRAVTYSEKKCCSIPCFVWLSSRTETLTSFNYIKETCILCLDMLLSLHQSQSLLRQPYKGNFREWQKSKGEAKPRTVTLRAWEGENNIRSDVWARPLWGEDERRPPRPRDGTEGTAKVSKWRRRQDWASEGQGEGHWVKVVLECGPQASARTCERGNHARVRNSRSVAQPHMFIKPSRWCQGRQCESHQAGIVREKQTCRRGWTRSSFRSEFPNHDNKAASSSEIFIEFSALTILPNTVNAQYLFTEQINININSEPLLWTNVSY